MNKKHKKLNTQDSINYKDHHLITVQHQILHILQILQITQIIEDKGLRTIITNPIILHTLKTINILITIIGIK